MNGTTHRCTKSLLRMTGYPAYAALEPKIIEFPIRKLIGLIRPSGVVFHRRRLRARISPKTAAVVRRLPTLDLLISERGWTSIAMTLIRAPRRLALISISITYMPERLSMVRELKSLLLIMKVPSMVGRSPRIRNTHVRQPQERTLR